MKSRIVLSLLGLAGAVWATPLPIVGSGTLVAHFRASDSSVARNGSGHVTSWTADNNPAIVLNAAGTNHPGNISYSATGMNGAPEIVVADLSTQDRYLTGAIPGTRTATTMFWLGFYSGPTGLTSGQYVYSYGVDGSDGSQMDHQYDIGRFQLWGGGGTQSGADITGFNNIRTVWTTFYGEGTGNGHSAFANTTNLNVTSPNGGNYSVSGNLQLFGYQNSAGVGGGFNFNGRIGELIIYDGILNSTDVDAVRAYLQLRSQGDLGDPVPAAIPEPGTWGLMSMALAGVAAYRRRR